MNKNDFPILHELVHGRQLVYLDNAATTQKPQVVLDAIGNAYSHFNANVHRGVHHLSALATQAHEHAREQVAGFIHARSAEEIVFTKGTTDSINTLAFCLGEYVIQQDDEILVSELEHHSNIVPWQMMAQRKAANVKPIPILPNGLIDVEAFKHLLSPRTKIVALAMVSNVLGTLQPIEQLIALAHQQGALVLIDGAQSVPHMSVDVQALDCDFLAFSAHKLYGPTGVGVLYGKKEYLSALPPYQGGGEMIDKVSFEQTTYGPLPYRFEAGTPNYIGTYAFAQALSYIQQIGWPAIEQQERELTSYAQQQLQALEGVHIYAPETEKKGVISFNIYKHNQLIHPFDIGTLLDQQGVAVRTGHHCAQPLMHTLHVPGTVRISVALYNDQEDIDRFLTALQKAMFML